MADTPAKYEIRYVSDKGTVFPDTFYDLYYTPEGIVREVCHGEDEAGEKIWKPLRDRPRPDVEIQHRSASSDLFEPVAMFDSIARQEIEESGHTDPYDTYLDPWARDSSGGPSNFHGNAGGADAPRSPEDSQAAQEGYKNALEAYAAELPEVNGQ